MLTGDLNSWVGQLSNYVENDDTFMTYLMSMIMANDHELPRFSKDNIVNENGKLLLTFVKHGLKVS